MSVSFEVARLATAMDPLDRELASGLETFVELTRDLTQSPLFRENLVVELEPQDGNLVPVLHGPVGDLDTRGMLTYFRLLWQDGEPTQFSVLRSRLRGHVDASGKPDSAGLVAWLDDLGKNYSRVRRELPDFGVLEAELGESGEVVRDESVRAERIIDDWVNGVVFHKDDANRERIVFAGAPEMYGYAFLVAVHETTKVYVLFARMAKAILAEPGTPAEVSQASRSAR